MLRRFRNAACIFFLIVALAAAVESTAQAGGAEPAHRRSQQTAHDACLPLSFDAAASPLEERLFADVADGRLDDFEPLGAALVASGVEDNDGLRRYQAKSVALADELRRSSGYAGSPQDRVEAVLKFLHQRVFWRGYDLASTDLRRALDDGRFNCVSATVLFNYFAGTLDFECRGLEMPGHAMSRVLLSDGALDVETTCAKWFQPDTRLPRPEGALAAMIGDAGSADRVGAREVSAIQLAAMIYYNRGVYLLAEKRFAEAAAANAKAVRLDPKNALARGNLLATINNWAIALSNRGEYAASVALLRRGLAMDAKFQPFVQNYVHAHRQWIESLCRERRREGSRCNFDGGHRHDAR